ncbi:methylaspartate mutase [Burkholderia territorii]|uniref:methylaspartate mutase n=1 Tax=Burkholderia territorii TaxID=1503055 RepID=UPI00075A7112|nr:methylaspartate mutase [Burkholderia territorii]KVL44151.1 methylaspartate mutase [Burkholderia territorii]
MAGYFQSFVGEARRRGELVVQPRMGFGSIAAMRGGLERVAALPCRAIGTITLDSYTRVGDYASSLESLAAGRTLNGFPIVSHPQSEIREMLAPLYGPQFPIQIRHGTARPQEVFRRIAALGLDASEGGPVSYCMPYGRTPLAQAVRAWEESCRILAGETQAPHLESFGGCLLGQLCPPSLLISISILEALFFIQHGIRSVSLSYAQGTLPGQDRAALRVLRELAAQYLGGFDWHVVVYSYMGVFPRTPDGARRLIADSARLAKATGCERLIVKTVAEAHQIPTVDDNLDALQLAAESAAAQETESTAGADAAHDPEDYYAEILDEARTLIETTLSLDANVGAALVAAFRGGVLDIPFCLHADNAGRTTTRLDERGALRWCTTGRMPLPQPLIAQAGHAHAVTSDELLTMLSYISNRYDYPHLA